MIDTKRMPGKARAISTRLVAAFGTAMLLASLGAAAAPDDDTDDDDSTDSLTGGLGDSYACMRRRWSASMPPRVWGH